MITKEQLADIRKEIYNCNEKNTHAVVVLRLSSAGQPSSIASGSLQELVFLHAYLGTIMNNVLTKTQNVNDGPK